MGQWGLNSYDDDIVMDYIDQAKKNKKKLTAKIVLEAFSRAVEGEYRGGDDRVHLAGIILYGLRNKITIPCQYLLVARNMMLEVIKDPNSLRGWSEPVERGGMMLKELLILEVALKKAMKHLSC